MENKATLKLCNICLAAIQSREGMQTKMVLYTDENDPAESKCDWCGESGNDVLYEISK